MIMSEYGWFTLSMTLLCLLLICGISKIDEWWDTKGKEKDEEDHIPVSQEEEREIDQAVIKQLHEQRKREMQELIDAVNKEWIERYDGPPVQETDALIKRVNLLAQDRDCWVANAKANQKAYQEKDERIAELEALLQNILDDVKNGIIPKAHLDRIEELLK